MSQPQARAGPPAQRPGRPQEEGGWLKGVVRTVAMFMVCQLAMKYGMQYLGYGPKPGAAPPEASPGTNQASQASQAPSAPDAVNVSPLWPLSTVMTMALFTSISPMAADLQHTKPLVVWENLKLGDHKDQRELDFTLDVPPSVQHDNGSWWMDIVLIRGSGLDLAEKSPEDVTVYRKQLTRFLPKRRIRKEKKLIGGEEEAEGSEAEPEEKPAQTIVSHWSNNLTLTVVASTEPVNMAGLTVANAPFYNVVPHPPDSKPKYFFPPVFPNDFWLLKENMTPLNDTTKTVSLHVNYHAISHFKFNIYSSMTVSFEQAAQQQGGSGGEMDEIKRMLTETSPWLLITTGIVTVLHMLFEFLAFSSDIGHWRKKDRDLVGVSLNTILTNCFVQLVILLYLQDSSEETSFMILFTQGIGLLIEGWKITKVVDVRVRENPKSLIGYSVTFEDKKVLSEDEKKTQEYDNLAFRLVSYFAIPALAGYTIYSLLYETHRGWYSFIVTTLAQAIYMFGFVQLVPQLIINYKMKSVAHIPMKAMMYKTLSTVVDDFFAFCVRMPLLHRLACFRDDVVFLVLLYQRWIYRIDYSRVNEYGQVAEGMAEPVGDKKKAEAINGSEEKEESRKTR